MVLRTSSFGLSVLSVWAFRDDLAFELRLQAGLDQVEALAGAFFQSTAVRDYDPAAVHLTAIE
jgi:hypothetical protein